MTERRRSALGLVLVFVVMLAASASVVWAVAGTGGMVGAVRLVARFERNRRW